MTEKDKILRRIEEGLMVSAPSPGHGDTTHHAVVSSLVFNNPRAWLPMVGESFDERLALFQKNAADLKATFYLLDNQKELSNLLIRLRDTEGWKKIGSHAGELTDIACRTLELPVCQADQTYNVTDLEICDAAISECDALIAQTGSVLVTCRSAGGRALSVLPPHHVVLARRGQLLGDLTDAFALLKKKYSHNYPSFISFITGPSRTGDIERVLVLGAHGPKKLTILCL